MQAGTSEDDKVTIDIKAGDYILSDQVGTGFLSGAQHGVGKVGDTVLAFIIDLTPKNPNTVNDDVAAVAAAQQGSMVPAKFTTPTDDQVNPKDCEKNKWKKWHKQSKTEDPVAYSQHQRNAGTKLLLD